MSWKCEKCGSEGDKNTKETLGFILLRGCLNCTNIKIPRLCNKCGHGPCVCKNKLGKALKEIRIAKGYTLREVEDKCDISNPYLSQLENGKVIDISFKKLVILCRLYEVDIKYFEKLI